MYKSSIATIVILGVALVAAGVFCFSLIQDKSLLTAELNATQTELASTKSELAGTSESLASTKQALAAAHTELAATKDSFTSTRSELGSTKDILTSTRTVLDTTNQTLASKLVELNNATAQLTTTQKSLATLQASASTAEQKLATAQDTLKGLGITLSASYECYDVRLTDNATAHDPTLQELKAFLAKDKTENHVYIENTYDCSQFSQAVHNNAEAAGLRAAEVQVAFKNEMAGHALDAFLTTDAGLVYVDCTEAPDKIAYLITGKEYKAVNANFITAPNLRNDSWWNSLSSYYYMQGSSGGRVITSSFKIFW
jgi:hypothetical protein